MLSLVRSGSTDIRVCLGPFSVGKIEIGIYVVGAADELIRVDHFLPEDISVRYQVV